MKLRPIKVFVSLGSPFLFGMERSVIEIFEAIRPQVLAHFLLTQSIVRLDSPLLHAVRSAGISHCFLSDTVDWPAPHRPKTRRAAWELIKANWFGNRDTLLSSSANDVFYIASPRSLYAGLMTMVWFRLRAKPVVFAFHDSIEQASSLLRIFAPLISHFVFHSEFARSAFERSNPWGRRANTQTIPLIIKELPTNSTTVNAGGKRVIFFSGQIAKYKGADLLLVAFNMIRAEFPDVVLQFAGIVQQGFAEEFDVLTAGMTDSVVCLGYRDDVPELMRGAYVFVQPSRPSMVSESFGRGVVEAMLAGVPSICFRSGALAEHVLHGETGLVCEEESAECLAEALRVLLGSEQIRNCFGQSARDRYMRVYETGVLAKRWSAYFAGL